MNGFHELNAEQLQAAEGGASFGFSDVFADNLLTALSGFFLFSLIFGIDLDFSFLDILGLFS